MKCQCDDPACTCLGHYRDVGGEYRDEFERDNSIRIPDAVRDGLCKHCADRRDWLGTADREAIAAVEHLMEQGE